MGYTTEFTGAIGLSRKLTLAEAKELLEIAENGNGGEETTGIDAYFQWVPATTLEHIVWDGNEKFYKYKEQLQWLCSWLGQRGIVANGNLYWSGEETGDTGTLTVTDNSVVAYQNPSGNQKGIRPMTLADLGQMALAQVTAA